MKKHIALLIILSAVILYVASYFIRRDRLDLHISFSENGKSKYIIVLAKSHFEQHLFYPMLFIENRLLHGAPRNRITKRQIIKQHQSTLQTSLNESWELPEYRFSLVSTDDTAEQDAAANP